MSLDFNAWKVDLQSKTAFHETGCKIAVEGNPSSPQGIVPSHFPDSMSASDQAALLRCGLKAVVKAAQDARKQNQQAIA